MTEKEFIADIKKISKTRSHRFVNSYGTRDYYYYFRKKNKNLTEAQFSSALRALFLSVANDLCLGEDFHIPQSMGKIQLAKRQKKVWFENGTLLSNLPINWNETLKLWYSNDSCRKKKTIVRCDNENIFKVIYNRGTANYLNKNFMKFKSNRDLKQALKNAIVNNNLDSFLYEDR